MINNWGPYYTRRISEFLNGTWKSEDTLGGLGQEMIALGGLLPTIPNRVHLQAQDVISRIASGQQHPFVGPVGRQGGKGLLAPGEVASDSDLLTMNYYVDGLKSVFPAAS
jgi:simple sugar transport system substrate-binding protein